MELSRLFIHRKLHIVSPASLHVVWLLTLIYPCRIGVDESIACAAAHLQKATPTYLPQCSLPWLLLKIHYMLLCQLQPDPCIPSMQLHPDTSLLEDLLYLVLSTWLEHISSLPCRYPLLRSLVCLLELCQSLDHYSHLSEHHHRLLVIQCIDRSTWYLSKQDKASLPFLIKQESILPLSCMTQATLDTLLPSKTPSHCRNKQRLRRSIDHSHLLLLDLIHQLALLLSQTRLLQMQILLLPLSIPMARQAVYRARILSQKI